MRCVRLSLVFAATVFVVVASEAQPQPFTPAPIAPTPLAVVMLSGIDDPAVIDDLKLKDDQVKALVARRKELWDESYTTAPNKLAEMAKERTEATDALFKKTLTAEQYKRATQLGAQSVLGSRNFGEPDAPPTFRLTTVTSTTLRRYPELVTAFKLTDEQKKQLTAPAVVADKGGKAGSRAIAMSKDQAAAAKEFLGPVAKSWQGKFDPRNAARPTSPANFSLLEAKDVRTDLKLTYAEAKTLAALAEKWQKLSNDRFTDLSPKEADAQAAVLKTESEKALAALKPEQLMRLKQIAFQTGGFRGPPGGGFGAPRAAALHIEQLIMSAVVVKELTISEKQANEFLALREAFDKDAAAVLAAADTAAPAEKKLNDLVAARRAKGEKLLTADQAAKWKELVGEPFTGSTQRDGVVFGTLNVAERRAAAFGKYSTELSFLARNKSIQEELKLSEEQIKSAAEKYTEVLAIRLTVASDAEGYAKALAERSKLTETALGKILSEDQAKRFRQIMLQSRERTVTPKGGLGGPLAINSAAAYPGVADAVKLDAEQKKKLLAGTAPAEVLSAAQKSAIQEMLGEPFKGTFTAGPAGTPFPQPSAAVRLFSGANKPAEEALKLTEDQLKALATAREAYQKAIQDAQPFGGGPITNISEYIEALGKIYAAFDKAFADLLSADQKARLVQLAVQTDAAQNLVAALTAPETAKKLSLTEEQKTKLTALDDEAMKLHALRTTHIGRSGPAAEDKLGLQMRDAADERVLAVLTDAQKKTWKELTGDPMPGLRKTVPTGTGFGGGFGPVGGGFGGGGFGGPGGGGFIPPG